MIPHGHSLDGEVPGEPRTRGDDPTAVETGTKTAT